MEPSRFAGDCQLKWIIEQIPQTHWRSSVLHFIKDPISLWKLIIIPRGGVEIDSDGMIEATDAVAHRRSTLLANYDSLIVRRFSN